MKENSQVVPVEQSDILLKEKVTSLEYEKLKLERKRLKQEREIKMLEINIQNAQLAKGQWSGPIAAAVFAGLIGIITTYLSGNQNRELERQKQEGNILIEAIKTTGTGTDKEKLTAANLVFFADAGLINIPEDRLKKLRKTAGNTLPSLPANNAPSQPIENTKAYEKIRQDVSYAVAYLNKRFNMNRDTPEITHLPSQTKNAYWDGEHFAAPEAVQYMPDITYREISQAYLYRTSVFKNYADVTGQTGALFHSYSDIYASLIKQNRLNQTAQTADWVVGAKGEAWLIGEDLATTKNLTPIRSLKAPGTAYNSSLLGKDPQPAHMDNIYKGSADNGGVHINSGIPNKAFYETAIIVGSEKANEIWYMALRKLKPKSGFRAAALTTTQVAGELYGQKSFEQNTVIKAWTKVGINTSSK